MADAPGHALTSLPIVRLLQDQACWPDMHAHPAVCVSSKCVSTDCSTAIGSNSGSYCRYKTPEGPLVVGACIQVWLPLYICTFLYICTLCASVLSVHLYFRCICTLCTSVHLHICVMYACACVSEIVHLLRAFVIQWQCTCM